MSIFTGSSKSGSTMSFLTSSALLGGFLKGPYFHLRRLVGNNNYRQVALLKFMHGLSQRYTEKTIKAFGVRYSVPDVASFLGMLDEIYGSEIYRFSVNTESPLIVDIGANIGVSVNYFLACYPQARILAFEADPKIFNHLVRNVPADNRNVELINKAVWNENTRLNFSQEGADGGRVEGSAGIEIDAVDIREVIQGKKIDLLKIDIEGAEQQVLPACAGMLGNVNRIFVEYHSVSGCQQRLDEILKVLVDQGFRLHFQTLWESPRPFHQQEVHGDFDMQMNIFGWKDVV